MHAHTKFAKNDEDWIEKEEEAPCCAPRTYEWEGSKNQRDKWEWNNESGREAMRIEGVS